MPRADAAWLLARARERPSHTAVSWRGRDTSWAELAKSAQAHASRLCAVGAKPGACVALLMAPSLAWVELAHAVALAGATLVPLNTRLTAGEIAGILAGCRPRLLLYDAANAPLANDACTMAQVPALEAVDAAVDLERVRPHATDPVIDDERVGTVLYTSGTTGRPKGVQLTLAHHRANATAAGRRLSTSGDDRWLLVLPPYHVGGLAIVLRAALAGFSIVVHDRFDAEAVERAIRTDGITGVSLVPTMLARMLEQGSPRAYPASLRCVLVGGGPISAALVDHALERGLPVACTYGLTEAASQVCTGWVGRGPAGARDLERLHDASLGWVGQALSGTQVRIEGAGADGVGEILVRGPGVMRGYLGEPEETARVLREGWLHTGDLGRMDARGHLWVSARRSDLVVSGGENVYPAEVEAVLEQHPRIRAAAVYGEADPEWGQRVCAAIETGDPELDAATLARWCVGRLAGFKVPRVVSAVEELPRTASGKIERSRLASLAARGRRSQRG